MSVYGIVCEFNPFHNGHKYLIDCAREMGAERIVCVMSGNSTQRGELALCDKYYRAEMAVDGGADLVLELPYPFCSASAEFFAYGAISVLSEFCDTVIFGSECGDISLLCQCAEFAGSENFKGQYAQMLENGEQSAYAFTSIIKENLGISLSSNDILGVEYVKAAKRIGSSLDFVTVKRKGSGYLCEDIESGSTDFPSAMAIRKAIAENGIASLENGLPKAAEEILGKALTRGDIVDENKYLDAARIFFRLKDALDVCDVAEMSEGIAERLCNKAHESSEGKEFSHSISTKRYTDAKLRRAILFAMTGVKTDDLRIAPEYTLVLGANKVGREILAQKRREDMKIKVITKPADLFSDEKLKRQSELLRNLDALYTFCLEDSRPTGHIVRKKSYIT